MNSAQYTASLAVKQQRGKIQSCRNCVMVSFFVAPVTYNINTLDWRSSSLFYTSYLR